MNATKTLTVGSLFSGIGGLDLGLERAGMRVIWQSEIDPYACKVLAKHWPEVPNLGDIKRINFADVVRPDVICGGYPCQPFSTAGKRQGEEDVRHLWPWVRQALRVLRPRYAILENVRGHLSLGGTTVLSEIAALGYSAEWRVVSAASVGANHRRDRLVIVAYSDGSSQTDGRQRPLVSSQDRSRRNDRGGSHSNFRQVTVRGAGKDSGDVADSDVREISRRDRRHETDRGEVFSRGNLCRGTQSYEGWKWWETEPDVGRVAHGVSARVDRLRGLGNAVVPQVAEVIGRLVVGHAGT